MGIIALEHVPGWTSEPLTHLHMGQEAALVSKWVLNRACKETYKHLNAEFQRIARRDKKAFHSDQWKEIEETTDWERLKISSRKLEIPREHFMQRWAQ